MDSLYHSKSLFAVFSEHNKTGANYEIDIFHDRIHLLEHKSLLPAYMANKHGLIGILLNKLFSSWMKKEEFTVDLKNIKKMEISRTSVMGMKNANLMFWNVEPDKTTYENIYFTLNLPSGEEEKLKTVFADLIKKVDFSEKNN